MEITHAQEPWSKHADTIFDADRSAVAAMCLPNKSNNSQRIVACVNACEGIPQDWLESGLSGCLQNVRVERDMYKQQRDNMLSALKLISESEICPTVLAQVAINEMNDVHDSAIDEPTKEAQKLGFYEVKNEQTPSY